MLALRHPALLTALVLATMDSAALAQDAVAWDFSLMDPDRPFVEPIDIAPRPDGGCYLLAHGAETSAAYGQDVDVHLVAFDALGEILWVQSGVSVYATNGFYQRTGAALAVDDAGNAYLAVARSTGSRLRSFSPDGTQRWAEMVTPFGSGQGCVVTEMEITPGGRLAVAGYSHHSTWPVPHAELFELDGTRLWRWQGLPNDPTSGMPHGLVVGPNDEVHLHGQNDWFVGYSWAPMHLILSAAGVPTFVGAGGPSSAEVAAEFAEGDALGNVALLERGWVSNFPNSDPFLKIRWRDAAGATFATVDLGPSFVNSYVPAVNDFELAPTGEVRFALRGEAFVRRASPTGGALAHWALPAPATEVRAMLSTQGGGLVVTGLAGPAEAFDAEFDASGAVLWFHTKPGIEPPRESGPAPVLTRFDVERDSRGNFLMSGCTLRGGSPGTSARLTKRIEGTGVGAPYCGPAPVNSTGASAEIRAFGSDLAATDNVSLITSALPPNTYVLYLASESSGFVAHPGGSQGNLCLGGSIGRFVGRNQLRRSSPDGTTYLQLDLEVLPTPNGTAAASMGETWRFQSWYRDVVGGAATSNFSDAVAVTLQ